MEKTVRIFQLNGREWYREIPSGQSTGGAAIDGEPPSVDDTPSS
jgi:hypothetical protein